jgi:hypothetical protein
MKRMLSLMVATVCCMLAGCTQDAPLPAVKVKPVDASAPEREKAQNQMIAWGAHDDPKLLAKKVEALMEESKSLLGEPDQWPDCASLLDHAEKLSSSSTFYEISLAPGAYQKATGMGCAIDVSKLGDRFGLHLNMLLDKEKIAADSDQVEQVVASLAKEASRDEGSCVHRTMSKARAEGVSLEIGMSRVRAECARPD